MMMVVACWIAHAASPPTSRLDVHLQTRKFQWSCKLPLREVLVFGSLLYGLLNVPNWIYLGIQYSFSTGGKPRRFFAT